MNERHNGNGPRSRSVEIEVFRMDKVNEAHVLFLDEHLGTMVHWAGKGLACLGEGCPHCRKRVRNDWRGYAPVEIGVQVDGQNWARPYVLEITDRLRIYLGEDKLRGTVWRLWKRQNTRAKTECYGEFIRADDLATVRPGFNVVPVVERMYHVSPMIWGATPPFAAPQIMDMRPVVPTPIIRPSGPQIEASGERQAAQNLLRKFRQSLNEGKPLDDQAEKDIREGKP